jgi:hypothetical protein
MHRRKRWRVSLERLLTVERDLFESESDAAAWSCRIAAAAGTLMVIGLAIDASYWKTTYGFAPPGHVAAAMLSAASVVLLVVMRERPRKWLGSAVFVVDIAVVLAALSWSDGVLAHADPHWVPFDAHKLGALAVALLAPPTVWVGLVAIAGFTVAPLLELHAWEPEVRARMPAAPWATLAYGVFACGLYAVQIRRYALMRRAARAEAEAAALERFARMVLALRDLANTPLQTVELTTALLRRRGEPDPRLLDRILRACDRLVATSRVLDRYAIDPSRWRRSEEAFDPAQVLGGEKTKAR